MRDDKELLNSLYTKGILTKEQALSAFKHTRDQDTNIANYLVNKELVRDQDIVDVVAEPLNIPVITDMYAIESNLEAISRINEGPARKYKILPIEWDKKSQTITVIAPVREIRNADLKDTIKLISRARHIKYKTATVENIELGISRLYRVESELKKIADSSEEEKRQQTSDKEPEELIEVVEKSPVVRFVDLILDQAITDGASDIHIEPDENVIRVRFRIDGVLHDVNQAAGSLGPELSSRIKILSELDIAKRQVPQDGRLTYMHETVGKMDLRVSTLPTVWGEKIVMRILDNSSASLALQDLGFSDLNLQRFRSAYTKPYGMILVTGPTGSGKSTTLYAALNEISSPDINIVTVEDPVEYRIPRINQIQVRPKQGLTFALALRSILRNDPDVILVGEIRDHETATIAVESGLTGHLVLSTLHTNTASSAVTRLSEMGIEPFLVGSVVEAVLAQRLIRKLCKNCKEPYTPEEEFLDKVEFPYKEGEIPTLQASKGCPMCAETGYKGRMAVHEVLLVDDHVEKMAVGGSTPTEIEDYAITAGMMTLKQDGWERVKEGVTSIEEILRVIA